MFVYFMLLFVIIFITNFIVHGLKVKTLSNEKLIDIKNSYQYKISFLLNFLILGIFSALRDDIGLDYIAYIRHIGNIQMGADTYMESGFELLCECLYQISTNPRTVMVVMSFATVFFYLLAIYKMSNNIVMSLFIFLTWGYYFLTFMSVRNYFALALIFYALSFLKERKNLLFFSLVLLAAQFHKSAYVCLPIYLIASKKINKNVLILGSILVILFAIIFTEEARLIAFYFYPGYENSLYDTGNASYLNIIKAVIVVIFGYIYYKNFKHEDGEQEKIFFSLNVMALICYVGFYWLPEISRVGFYMNVTTIVFLPNIIRNEYRVRTRLLYKGVIYIGSLVLFYLLMEGFYAPSTGLLPYSTWLKTGY